MKQKLTQNPIVLVVTIVALAAGTLLVAGYADKPNDSVQVAAEAQCAACPLQGSESCCKAGSDSCGGSEDCASACEGKGCAGACDKQGCDSQAGGCIREKAAAASCSVSPCGGQSTTTCGGGGCTLPK